MPLNQEDLYEKINELVDILETLTDKEYDFVMTVADYRHEGRKLTQLQANWVEELYRRYV
jgi:hypothetical protein